VFRVSRGIKTADLVEESGYHRSHILRIRQATIEPGRDAIAAIVSALRRLSLEDVRPEIVFELSREESGPWKRERARTASREIAAYRRERERTHRILGHVVREPRPRWADAARRSGRELFTALSRAAMFEGRRLIDSNPENAEALYGLATTLADEASDISREYRAFLAGRARLERANAFRQLGRYSAALPLLSDAERLFAGVPTCTHDLGRTWHARGSILFKMDGLDEALHALRLAVNIFAALDDQRRIARVQFVEGNVLFEQRRVEDARALWLSILPTFEAGRDRHSLASLLLNLGWCDLDRGDPAAARQWLHRAHERFGQLRSRADLARTSWALALTEARHGDREAGLRALRRSRDDLEAVALLTEAGMVALDIAEVLLLDAKNAAEAARLCRALPAFFEHAGAKKEMLKALAYLWEAANARRATPELVQRIRMEIKHADRDANYRFDAERVQ
jgi:tetratricopeptide (TPR) repeat protein